MFQTRYSTLCFKAQPQILVKMEQNYLNASLTHSEWIHFWDRFFLSPFGIRTTTAYDWDEELESNGLGSNTNSDINLGNFGQYFLNVTLFTN